LAETPRSVKSRERSIQYYVSCEGKQVVGYYALASGSIEQVRVSGKFRRNMPDPIPVVVLARLAVDRGRQGQGLGRAMFRDAAQRVVQAADTIGFAELWSMQFRKKARRFYETLGFDPCPAEAMTLILTLQDVRAALSLR
jgi:GNAT superfamily N-acetyltransferase